MRIQSYTARSFGDLDVVYKEGDVKALYEHHQEKIAQLEQENKELTEQNKRKDAFLEMHIRRWEGVESIDPSIQVLKRALGRVGESMGVPERLLNKESK